MHMKFCELQTFFLKKNPGKTDNIITKTVILFCQDMPMKQDHHMTYIEG